MLFLQMDVPFGYGLFALAAVTVSVGYFVFAITAFGAALLTVPMLSHFLPMPFVLPLAVLLDVGASLVVGIRFRTDADRRELRWMVPASLIGAILGVTLLVSLPRDAAMGALGFFTLAYGLYNLAGTTFRPISSAWAPIAGLTGGAMGTLFGIGAPPYAIYLSRRLTDKAAMRATLSTMVLFSTAIRLVVFALAGLVLADRLIAFALLFPFALAGLWVGQRVHVVLSREKVLVAISVLLIAYGISLLLRVIFAA